MGETTYQHVQDFFHQQDGCMYLIRSQNCSLLESPRMPKKKRPHKKRWNCLLFPDQVSISGRSKLLIHRTCRSSRNMYIYIHSCKHIYTYTPHIVGLQVKATYLAKSTLLNRFTWCHMPTNSTTENLAVLFRREFLDRCLPSGKSKKTKN